MRFVVATRVLGRQPTTPLLPRRETKTDLQPDHASSNPSCGRVDPSASITCLAFFFCFFFMALPSRNVR